MAEGGQDLKFEFMKILLKTGIGNCWPKFTNLIAGIKKEDGMVTWTKGYQTSGSHKHTEIQMLDDKEFKDEVEKGKADKTKKVDIILTSNYSPCRECADKLKNFYENRKSFIRKFTIRFSRLYRINKQTNINGLRHLNSAGITLEAMTEESWFNVLMEQLVGLDPVSVKNRDEGTRVELEKLLGEDSSESSNKSGSPDFKAQRVVSSMKNWNLESD